MEAKEMDAQRKLQIVLEGLERGREEVCNKYGINDDQFEEWKSMLVDSADDVFVSQEEKQEKIERAARKLFRRYRLKANRV